MRKQAKDARIPSQVKIASENAAAVPSPPAVSPFAVPKYRCTSNCKHPFLHSTSLSDCQIGIMAQRPSDRPAAHGSRTTTVEHTPEVEAGPSRGPSESTPVLGVLKLRGAPLKKQRVVWSEETVDNEGMGKKKSKSEPFSTMAP